MKQKVKGRQKKGRACTSNSFKDLLSKEINTDKFLNTDSIMRVNMLLVGCIIVFNLFLIQFFFMDQPEYKQDLMTPAIQSLGQATANVFVATGEMIGNATQAFSLSQGPLADSFEVTEFIGQRINKSITGTIFSVQQSLDFSIHRSLALTN